MVTDIGFLSEMEPNWNIWDSTKVGGKPVWLNPEYIPEPILCKHCNSPMMFLLQSYLPYEEREDSYHRVIYVFICSKQECIEKGSCVALRCQLPHDNKYYHSDEESHYTDPTDPSCPLYWKNCLCNYCNQKGTLACTKCNKVHYCSQKHQACDWVYSHKNSCNQSEAADSVNKTIVRYVLPEYEVSLDEESNYIDEAKESKLESDYQKYLKKAEEYNAMNSFTDADIRDIVKHSSMKDPYLYKFNHTIQFASNQILRLYYWDDSSILWINYKTKIEQEKKQQIIPPCPRCHGERKCEIQIMPQIIYYLEQSEQPIPSIDFGTILIYTCSNACELSQDSSDCYVEECTFIQQFDQTEDMDEEEEEIIEESMN